MNTKTEQSEKTLLASLREIPRPVWILFFGTFLNKFGTFVIPFLTLYMTGRGFTLQEAGATVGAYGAGHFFASLIGGQLADRFGRRPIIMLSMFSTAAIMLLMPRAEAFWAVMILAALAGLTGELYRPASAALLADLIPAGQRLRAYAAYRIAFNAGWACGPAVGGILVKSSFDWLFLGDAITSALYGLLAFFALPDGKKTAQKEASWGEAFAVIRRDAQFIRLLIASTMVGVVFFQMCSTLGIYMKSLGYSTTTYGLLISLNGVLVVIFELPLTIWSARMNVIKSMAIGYAVIGVGFGLQTILVTLPGLVVCLAIWTAGEMFAFPQAVTYVADIAPSNMRGRYMGMFGFTWAGAMTIGPWLGMTVIQVSPALLWIGCAALSFASAAVLIGRKREPVAAELAAAVVR